MLPGPDQIVACPLCHTLAKYATLLSGNTFGARVWTDGKQEAPMLPRPPAVVKCASCGGCYWLADAEKIGELDAWGEEPLAADDPMAPPEGWYAAEYVAEPSEAEYYAAIRSGLAQDPQQERALRIFAWWRSNDLHRDVDEEQIADPASRSEREENLLALLPLLVGDGDQDHVMRGEVLRELGRWNEADDALRQVTSPELAAAVEQIRSLCHAGDSLVRELDFG